MKGFLLSRKETDLEKISQEINNLPRRESLRLSSDGYICMQVKNGDGEETRNFTGKGIFILSKLEKEKFVLEFKNQILDDSNLYYKDTFETKENWQFIQQKPTRGIGAPLNDKQEINIYSL